MEYILFFRETEPKWGIFSNWYTSYFKDDSGTLYSCMEQYMMAEKARLFGDKETEEKIMKTDKPRQMKRLGRKVAGFDEEVWKQKARDIVTQGCYLKFSQNEELKQGLLDTGSAIIAEANPWDKLWSIGLAADHKNAKNREAWKGSNWLGECLMTVRDRFRTMAPDTRAAKRRASALDHDFWAIINGNTHKSAVLTDKAAAEAECRNNRVCICKKFTMKIEAEKYINATLEGKKRSIRDPIWSLGPKRQKVLDEQAEEIQVWTDGAAPDNGNGNVAGIGVFFGLGHPWNVAKQFTPYAGMRATNQTAELAAAVEALEICLKHSHIKRVILYTDSMYTINCVTLWIDNWKKNGWKNARGKPVVNAPLIQKLDRLVNNNKRVNVTLLHVPGHAGVYGNEEADRLAVAACKRSAEEKKQVVYVNFF